MFWDHVEMQDDGCWIWTGAKHRHGYGACAKGRTKEYSNIAHRRAYQMVVGPIPEGLVIDHLCRVPACVNPSHLEPVTQKVNVQRGLNGVLRIQCLRGHEYNEENTYITPRGSKACRVCDREKHQRRRREMQVSES